MSRVGAWAHAETTSASVIVQDLGRASKQYAQLARRKPNVTKAEKKAARKARTAARLEGKT